MSFELLLMVFAWYWLIIVVLTTKRTWKDCVVAAPRRLTTLRRFSVAPELRRVNPSADQSECSILPFLLSVVAAFLPRIQALQHKL